MSNTASETYYKEYLKNSPKAQNANLIEIIYKKDGSVIDYLCYSETADQTFIPNDFKNKSIFDFFIPTKGLTKIQFRDLLTTVLDQTITLMLLIPPNPNNIKESDYFNTDLLTQNAGIPSTANLRYIGEDAFLIQIIIKHKQVLELPGNITSDIMLLLDDNYNIL